MSNDAAPALPLTPAAPVLDLFGLKGQTALITGASRGMHCLRCTPIDFEAER